MTELAVVYRSVDELIPYARNARTHSDEQIAQIAGSIHEFGFTNPVLLDGESGILAGHGRVLAARKLGMTEVPCIALFHSHAVIATPVKNAAPSTTDLGTVSI
jgi:ParB-like chromosome segregation protein Spo0J